jgi:ferredoxin
MAKHIDIEEQKRIDAETITMAIADYIKLYGCGEQGGCYTCDMAVAIDLPHLDAAYQAGYNKAKSE